MLASLYSPLYHILIAILTVITVNKYPYSFLRFKYRNTSYFGQAFLLASFLILSIGLRPAHSGYFVDMYAYRHRYFLNFSSRFWFDWDTENLIFDNLLAWMASERINIDFFFLLLAFIYFGCMLWACRRLYPRDTLLSFLMYLGAFSTYQFSVNGIKAGAAASLFLVALSYYNKNKIIVVLFLLLSLGFHHSMIVPIVAYIIAYFYKNPKYYLYGWLLCLLLAAAHITFFMNYFSGFTDEHGAGYLQTGTQNKSLYVSGFRPDFILYSAVPILTGYYIINKKKIYSKIFVFLWCVYTLTNCVFLLCTYGTFINRIAYLSWLMLPFVLLYPFIYFKWSFHQHQYLMYVVFGHLGFTLFMNFIYYNLR